MRTGYQDQGPDVLTGTDEIEAFLSATGEDDVLASYRALQDRYGDRLEPELSVERDGQEPRYELSIDNELERKGQRSGKGTALVSRLIGRRHSWPQEFGGTVDPTDLEDAYETALEGA